MAEVRCWVNNGGDLPGSRKMNSMKFREATEAAVC